MATTRGLLVVLCGLVLAACAGKDKVSDTAGAEEIADITARDIEEAVGPDVCLPKCEQYAPYCGMSDGCWHACGCPAGYECLELKEEPGFCNEMNCHGVGMCFSYENDCPALCGDAGCGTLSPPELDWAEAPCQCGECPPEQPHCWTDNTCHVEVEPGDFDTPCESHVDCLWGWCIQIFEGNALCTVSCYDGCPEGWECRCDPFWCEEWFCVPFDVYVCMPCTSSDECGSLNACLDSDTVGQVCVDYCKEDSDCLAGYECVMGKTVEGQEGSFCLPEGGIACKCSLEASQVQVEGGCTMENDFGKCPGTRKCLPDGTISECEGQMPAPEECDGVDNNCDGDTDEGCDCVPDCEGKECGDDGCGGNCGECDGPKMECVEGECQVVCDCLDDADCQPVEDSDLCNGKLVCGLTTPCMCELEPDSVVECPDGQVCIPETGECCSPSCEGKECGDDGCGGSCGGPCPCNFECVDGQCAELCEPECQDKQCGDGGCGCPDLCGTCPDGQACNEWGQCE